jgi:hypothetical protein
MRTFKESLEAGFKKEYAGKHPKLKLQEWPCAFYWSFKFGDKLEYELCFEPLLFENQHYVAVYKNGELLTEKVVIKPGYNRKVEK